MRVIVEQEVDRDIVLELDGDHISALAGPRLFAPRETDLRARLFPPAAQQPVDVIFEIFKKIPRLLLFLVLERLRLSVVNPTGGPDVDLNLPVLLPLAELGPLLVGIDDVVDERLRNRRDALVECRELPGP